MSLTLRVSRQEKWDQINTYATLIDSGSLTPLELATQVAEHPLNAESIDLIGLATTGIENA